MTPLIEVSEDYLNELNPKKYTRRHDLEKKLQNSEENKKDFLTKYFSIPQENGSFNIEYSKELKEDNIFYKIDYSKDSNQGKLSYISGELDKRAIEGIDHYLVPVCEIQNISNRKNANKIELIEPGEVFLNGSKWSITEKKVKIKFV